MQVLGLAEIRLAEDLSSEGAQEWSFKNLANTRNSCSFVKSMNLGVIWPKKVWSGEFRRNNLVESVGLVAIGMNKFLSGEFHVFFMENSHLCLWVSPWRFDGNVKM